MKPHGECHKHGRLGRYRINPIQGRKLEFRLGGGQLLLKLSVIGRWETVANGTDLKNKSQECKALIEENRQFPVVIATG